MKTRGQISMEYLLIIGVILVIAAGAVLVMTKFNPAKTSEESVGKSEEILTESMVKFGKVAITQMALDSTTGLSLSIQNNDDNTLRITKIYFCDASNADCTLCTTTHNLGANCDSGIGTNIAVGAASDIIGCNPDVSLLNMSPGTQYKLKLMMKYTKGTSSIEKPTTPQTVKMTAG